MNRKPIRGRFQIVCPFADGAYLRIGSRKGQSLNRSELIAEIKKAVELLEAPDRNKRDKQQ